jgi:hypothetical protein
MINFGLGLGFSSGLRFGSTPQRPEWESVSLIFGSHVYFPFYQDFLIQLQEVIEGKRQKFTFDEEKDYEEFVPGEAVDIKLTVLSPESIEIDDFYTNKQLIVSTEELIRTVKNWLKFVEVNTTAFS